MSESGISCPNCQFENPSHAVFCSRCGFSLKEKDGDPFIGKRVGKVELVKRIGYGGSGAVYKGKHVDLGNWFAVKVLRADLVSDEETQARFEREAKVLARIQHRNVVSIHDFGYLSGLGPYMTMEWLEGETLFEVRKRRGTLTFAEILSVFDQLTSAMYFMHNREIIHRDLKPENMMMVHSGDERHQSEHSVRSRQLKVFDFGIALLKVENERRLTAAGMVVGTPHYMAPEQIIIDAKVDHRADLYAIGAILYEMLTGRPPFWGVKRPIQVMERHLRQLPPPLSEVNPHRKFSDALQAMVFKALAKKPMERYQSALEFFEALENALHHDQDQTLSGERNVFPTSRKVIVQPGTGQHAPRNTPQHSPAQIPHTSSPPETPKTKVKPIFNIQSEAPGHTDRTLSVQDPKSLPEWEEEYEETQVAEQIYFSPSQSELDLSYVERYTDTVSSLLAEKQDVYAEPVRALPHFPTTGQQQPAENPMSTSNTSFDELSATPFPGQNSSKGTLPIVHDASMASLPTIRPYGTNAQLPVFSTPRTPIPPSVVKNPSGYQPDFQSQTNHPSSRVHPSVLGTQRDLASVMRPYLSPHQQDLPSVEPPLPKNLEQDLPSVAIPGRDNAKHFPTSDSEPLSPFEDYPPPPMLSSPKTQPALMKNSAQNGSASPPQGQPPRHASPQMTRNLQISPPTPNHSLLEQDEQPQPQSPTRRWNLPTLLSISFLLGLVFVALMYLILFLGSSH
ncbi:MAG: protein kinase [Myxococcota bacterium]